MSEPWDDIVRRAAHLLGTDEDYTRGRGGPAVVMAALDHLETLREELRVGNALCARLTDRQNDVERERNTACRELAVMGKALVSAEAEVARLTEERDEARNALEAVEHEHRDCGAAIASERMQRDAAEAEIAALRKRIDEGQVAAFCTECRDTAVAYRVDEWPTDADMPWCDRGEGCREGKQMVRVRIVPDPEVTNG